MRTKIWVFVFFTLFMMSAAGIAEAGSFRLGWTTREDITTGEITINDQVAWRVHVVTGDAVPAAVMQGSKAMVVKPDIDSGMFVIRFNGDYWKKTLSSWWGGSKQI